MLSNFKRAIDVENAFDNQINGEDKRDEIQSGADTREQSQSRANSNQCKNCIEPAGSDVVAKDGDQEGDHAADQGKYPKKLHNQKGEKQWGTQSQKPDEERENGAGDKPAAAFAVHSSDGLDDL